MGGSVGCPFLVEGWFMALDPAWLVCLSLCMAMGIALLGVVRWFRKLDRKREDDEEALERKRESEEEALAKAWKELEECKKIVDEEAAKGAKELDEASKALDALFEEERLKVEILKAQLEERKREVEDRLQEVARKEETMARKEEALRGEAASNVERRLAFEDERLKWEKERRLALEEEQVVVDGVTERLRKKLEEEESRYKVLMEEAQRKAQEYMRGLEEEGAKRVAEAKATEEALDERLKGLRSEVDLWSERYRI